MPCRLLILDDHMMLTQGLALLLAGQPDLEVAGQFVNGLALLTWLEAAPAPLPADVLLLDLHLPGPDGFALLPQLRQRWPQLRVLVFSTAASPDVVARAEAAGASGFVPKSADAELLLEAVRVVYAGQTAFLAGRLTTPATPMAASGSLLARLTAREREIIGLIRQGLTSRQIAEQLHLAEFTVSTHRRNIMHKLEIHSLAALVQFALDHGL